MAVHPRILILSSLVFFLISAQLVDSAGCYKSIISFGDSHTDTGNLLNLLRYENPPYFLLPPYGKTFFHRPTGRFSDGRVVTDFVAEGVELPLVLPYIDENGVKRKEFGKGVNYAVGGATALESYPWSVSPLGTQMGWFKEMMSSLCLNSSDCKEFIGDSLILMGEIGGNDYFYMLLDGTSIEVLETFVPLIVQNIASAIEELIEHGAKTLVVPGNLPIGCSAIFLTNLFKKSKKEDYDSYGCLNSLNKFSEYHNQMLQKEIHRLRKIHPHANIIYADYYNTLVPIYRSPEKFGFKRTFSSCCGGGGTYNYNASMNCGENLATCCDEPSEYINWDGGHFTEAAHKWIADGILKELNAKSAVCKMSHNTIVDQSNLLDQVFQVPVPMESEL